MPYYMIHRDSDGETRVSEVNIAALLPILADGGYDPDDFLSELPEHEDTNEWPGESAILLIKGKIVVPKAKEVTTKWEIE